MREGKRKGKREKNRQREWLIARVDKENEND